MNTYIKGRITKGEFVSELFKQRVESVGGTYEANDCLVNSLNSLTDREFKDAKAILTPNGYVVDKLPTIKPNGGGDATIVRNVVKTRVNSSGLIESMPANVLAPDYLNGVCPALNVQNQRTNLIPFSYDYSQWVSENGATIQSTTASSLNTVIDATTVKANSNTNARFRQGIALPTTARIPYVSSVFFKQKTAPIFRFDVRYRGGTELVFNSITYEFSTSSTTIVSNGTILDHFIVDYANSWKRFVIISENNNRGNNAMDSLVFPDFETGAGTTDVWNNDVVQDNVIDSTIFNNTLGSLTRSADTVTIPIPSGTTEIIEKYEDDTTNTITTIPASPYTVPTGKRYEYILMR